MSLWRDTMSPEEIGTMSFRARNKKAEEVYDILKRFQDISFEEGDFLLRYDASWDWDMPEGEERVWKVEQFSDINKSPRKYKVVYIDEAGLPYVQKVLFNGEMSGSATCLAGFDLDHVKFVPDPDFMDHHLLAEEEDVFDPLTIYKEKKRERSKVK